MLARYRQLFANRNYSLLWVGQTGSVVGDALYHVAFYWLAYKLSESPVVAGVVIFASSVPYLFLGLLGGVYADRLNRRRLMIGGDIARALTVAVIPLATWLGFMSVWLLGAVAFLLTSVRCFFYPAVKSTVADVLRDSERAVGVSFMQASQQAAKVLGTAAGGLLISLYSAEAVYALPVLTYGISVLALFRLQGKFAPASSGTQVSALADIADTVRSLQPNRALFWSIALFGFGLFFITGIDRIALPALSDREWRVGPEGLGLIMASFAVGNVAASLGVGLLKIDRHALVIFTGWALWGLFYALIGISPWFGLALAFAFLAGAAEALIDVPLVLLIQTSVARERMGKVFSMWSTVAFIGDAASALFAGFAVGLLGPQHAYVTAGACLIGLAIVGLVLTRAMSTVNATAPLHQRPDV